MQYTLITLLDLIALRGCMSTFHARSPTASSRGEEWRAAYDTLQEVWEHKMLFHLNSAQIGKWSEASSVSAPVTTSHSYSRLARTAEAKI